MLRTKWLLPLLSLLLAAGCQQAPVTMRTAVNPKPVKAVVSLSPGTTELNQMFLLTTLVGRTESDNFPAGIQNIPIIMNGTKPNFEEIARTGANGVVYDPLLTNQADLDKLKQMGLVLIPIGGDTLDAYIKTLYEAGSACGAETSVNDYVDSQIYKYLGSESSGLAGTHITVAMIMPGEGTNDMILGTRSFQADIMKRLGAQPVGPDSNEFVNLNAEQLLKDNPDVILTAGDPKSFAVDPRFSSLTAVKKLHVFGLNPDIALRQGARVDQLIQEMGEAIGSAK